jgi:diguanylate cyclase (GGDEF)-like protein
LFTILSGGFLIVTSVLRLSKPISHIFAIFAEKNQNLSYNDFEYEISKLVDNNEKMNEALNNQLPELKTSIFYYLLIGGYHDSDEIKHNLSKIDIKLDAKYYVVLIATINELNIKAKLEEISAQKIYINSILTQHFDNIQGVYNLDFQRTILLLSFENQNQDSVLKEVAALIKKAIRQDDTLVRLDSGEFYVFLPHTGMKDAEFVANKLKDVIEKNTFDTENKISISAGVTSLDEIERGIKKEDEMIRQTLEALKRAQDNGGRKVECY